MSRQRILHLTKKDFEVQTFRVSGAGGQRRDKVETGVRIKHPPSGAVGEATESRRQSDNKKTAFRRMADSPEFKRWVAVEHARAVGAIDAAVEAAMSPGNLEVEYGPFDD